MTSISQNGIDEALEKRHCCLIDTVWRTDVSVNIISVGDFVDASESVFRARIRLFVAAREY
jgi:hypothetical protein